MKGIPRLLAGGILFSVVVPLTPALSSQERNVEIATGMSCEELLGSAKTQYGSLVDIEYAIAFAWEDREIINRKRLAVGGSEELSKRSGEASLKIARLVAMHRLFQTPKCPMNDDWVKLELKIFTEDDWWFIDF